MLAAQEAYRRTDTLIAAIDRTVRGPLLRRADEPRPSPLLPQTWTAAVGGARRAHGRLPRRPSGPSSSEPKARSTGAARPAGQPGADHRRPRDGLHAAPLADRLGRAPPRPTPSTAGCVAWLVALRNLTRLVVPAVGAGLFFAAFDPGGLLTRADEGRFFALPPFVAGADRRGLAGREPDGARTQGVPADSARGRRGPAGGRGCILLLGAVVSLCAALQRPVGALGSLDHHPVGAAVPAGADRRRRALARRRR